VSGAATIENGAGAFELTSPTSPAPLRHDPLVAELIWRFGGRVVRRDPPKLTIAEDPELFLPSELQEPEWTGGFRGQVAKLLWERGLKKKAIRFLNCNLCGRPGVCARYPEEHKYFIPSGCEVVFCRECADVARRELFIAYWHVVCNAVLEFAAGREEHERICRVLYSSESEEAERKEAKKRLGELWTSVGGLIRERGWCSRGSISRFAPTAPRLRLSA
jgi:hypothetical protein